MEKVSILKHLNSAKKEYTSWAGTAHIIMKGAAPDRAYEPMEHTECDFGLWLQEEGKEMLCMPGMDHIKTIESLHEQIHDLYSKIFLVFASNEQHPLLHKVPILKKDPILSRLLTRKRRSTDFEKEVALEYYEQLKETAKALTASIEKLERRVTALPESSFCRNSGMTV